MHCRSMDTLLSSHPMPRTSKVALSLFGFRCRSEALTRAAGLIRGLQEPAMFELSAPLDVGRSASLSCSISRVCKKVPSYVWHDSPAYLPFVPALRATHAERASHSYPCPFVLSKDYSLQAQDASLHGTRSWHTWYFSLVLGVLTPCDFGMLNVPA